jgi:hypothetical protein
MPNVKIYIDETLLPTCREGLVAALPALRTMLCAALNVEVPACQFAILSVLVMPDLPRVNVEMQILPHPERTRDMLASLAALVQSNISSVTGTHTAVRIATLAPEGYVARK